MDRVLDRLQEHNIKPSMQRIAIMTYLMDHRTHPTVEEIYAALQPTMPTLSKTTVYNTLRVLSEQGAAQMLTIDEHNTCYDADTSLHAHFLCRQCGRVYDLPLSERSMKQQVKQSEGHEVQEIHCYYRGICKTCKEKEGVEGTSEISDNK